MSSWRSLPVLTRRQCFDSERALQVFLKGLLHIRIVIEPFTDQIRAAVSLDKAALLHMSFPMGESSTDHHDRRLASTDEDMRLP